MAALCGVSLHVCRIRVTRLNALGDVAGGPDNYYVSDKPISVQLTPNIEAGNETTLKSGCGCIIATRKDPDLLKRFDIEMAVAAIEPALLELLVHATLIEDAGYPIGVWWPENVSTGCLEERIPVAFEFWADVWEEDHQDPDLPYLHNLYPMTFWQIGQQTYQDDFAQPTITAFTRANPNWGSGPYGDQPEAIPAGAPGGLWGTSTVPPTAECGYQTITT